MTRKECLVPRHLGHRGSLPPPRVLASGALSPSVEWRVKHLATCGAEGTSNTCANAGFQSLSVIDDLESIGCAIDCFKAARVHSILFNTSSFSCPSCHISVAILKRNSGKVRERGKERLRKICLKLYPGHTYLLLAPSSQCLAVGPWLGAGGWEQSSGQVACPWDAREFSCSSLMVAF